jgi:hypothetical protein
MAGVNLTMLGLVQNLDTSDCFGSAYKAITPTNIRQITIPSTPLVVGVNSIEIPNATITGGFGFFELIAEGTGSDGRPVASAVGFISHRTIEKSFEISILNVSGGSPVNEVRAGAPVILHIRPVSGGALFQDKINQLSISLASRGSLLDPSGKPVGNILEGVNGATEIPVVFPSAPEGGREIVLVAGRSVTTSKVIPLFGASPAFYIVSDPTAVRNVPDIFPFSGSYRYEVIDLRGRVVQRFEDLERSTTSGLPARHFRNFGRGVYLVRTIDLVSGRVTQVRHIDIGR